MFNDPLLILVAVAILAVFGVLALGIGTFGKGGEFNRRNANKIMRWRVGLQFLAVVLIMTYIYIRHG